MVLACRGFVGEINKKRTSKDYTLYSLCWAFFQTLNIEIVFMVYTRLRSKQLEYIIEKYITHLTFVLGHIN